VWRVTTIDQHRSTVSLEATLHTRGILGRILYPVLRLQIARTSPQFLNDLKHYAEHGRPSPDKQRQLRATCPRLPPTGPLAPAEYDGTEHQNGEGSNQR
jgi:hypothetical protein